MANELDELIAEAEASEYSHVVMFLEPEGIRWRPQTESSCLVMAQVLGPEARVMPKTEFIEGLKRAIEINNKPPHGGD